MLSRDSSLTAHCAIVVSDLRLSPTMDVVDLLGALFLANSDRLAKYWDDPRNFDKLIAAEPQIGTLVHDLQRHGWEADFNRRAQVSGVFKEFSPRCRGVWLRMNALARLGPPAPTGTEPLAFPEHFLLAIVEQEDLDITRQLLASGLRVDTLRRDVEDGIT